MEEDKVSIELRKTELGLSENIEGALCYSVGFITGIIFLFLETKNKFVRFHALQSIIVFLPLFIILVIITFVPMFGILMPMMWWPTVVPIMYILELVVWLFLIFQALRGNRYKLPIAGDFAEKESEYPGLY